VAGHHKAGSQCKTALWEVPTYVLIGVQNGFGRNKSTDTADHTFIESIESVQEALGRGSMPSDCSVTYQRHMM
jgi:hypothetical protein